MYLTSRLRGSDTSRRSFGDAAGLAGVRTRLAGGRVERLVVARGVRGGGKVLLATGVLGGAAVLSRRRRTPSFRHCSIGMRHDQVGGGDYQSSQSIECACRPIVPSVGRIRFRMICLQSTMSSVVLCSSAAKASKAKSSARAVALLTILMLCWHIR